MVEHPPNEKRLRIQIADSEQHWNLCREKLTNDLFKNLRIP